jgi:hypothetical protein
MKALDIECLTFVQSGAEGQIVKFDLAAVRALLGVAVSA